MQPRPKTPTITIAHSNYLLHARKHMVHEFHLHPRRCCDILNHTFWYGTWYSTYIHIVAATSLALFLPESEEHKSFSAMPKSIGPRQGGCNAWQSQYRHCWMGLNWNRLLRPNVLTQKALAATRKCVATTRANNRRTIFCLSGKTKKHDHLRV